MAKFSLYNTQYGETVHKIEMDEDLLRPEAGILHADSMTLRPLKSGAAFTLLPEDDRTVAVLKRVHEVHTRITSEGCPLCTTWFHRMDELLQVVKLMFNKDKYVLVEIADDMQKLVDPPDDPSWEPKTVEYNVLGDLLDKVLADQEDPVVMPVADDD